MLLSNHHPQPQPGDRVHRCVRAERPGLASLVEAIDRSDATLLKQEGGRFVALVRTPGRDLVLKGRAFTSMLARVRCSLRVSTMHRQWSGARRLHGAGIPAARPIALLGRSPRAMEPLCRSLGLPPGGYEVLVLEHVPGETALEILSAHRLGVRRQHALARAVGVHAATMLRAGLCNRDHKPSNLIVCFEDDIPLLTLIDSVGIHRRGNPGELARMLSMLLIEPLGVGLRPRAALVYRVLRDACAAWLEGTLGRPLGAARSDPRALRALVRSTARRVEQYIETHGDPTPKVHPLRPPAQTPPRPSAPPSNAAYPDSP